MNKKLLINLMNQENSKKLLLIVLPFMVESIFAKGVKTRSFLAFPYGPLTIASYINSKNKNHKIKILDLNLHDNDNTILLDVISKELDDFNPDIVGFSMMFDQSYSYVDKLAQLIKSKKKRVPVILGGASATTAWNEIIVEQKNIDAICFSEGEVALLNLMNSDDFYSEFKKEPWITFEKVKEFGKDHKPKSIVENNLNSVVDLDYSFVDVNRYSMKEAFSPFASYRDKKNVKQFFLVTSRGCPFKCVFCAEPSLHGAGMRYADVDNIVSHVKKLKNKYGLNVLTFYDDQLLLNTKRAKELFRKLADLKIRCEAPNGVTLVYIDDEMANLMREAGFDTLPLAIESGSDYMLNKIIKKPLITKKIKPVVETLQKNEIFVQGYFVIGLPGEREIDREETIRVIKDSGIDWSGFSLASPVRGSELFVKAKENGWVNDEDLKLGNIQGNRYILNSGNIECTTEELIEKSYYMNLDVNFVNNRAMRIGNYETALRCFKEVSERYPGHAFAHDYLAKCYSAMNPFKYKKEIENNLNIKAKILREDSDNFWIKAYDYFRCHPNGYLKEYEYKKEKKELQLTIN